MAAAAAPAKVPPGRCSDCVQAKSCIKCCGAEFCLLHAHCTRHSQHPSLWKIIDKAEYNKTQETVTKFRLSVISALEAELEALEKLQAAELMVAAPAALSGGAGGDAAAAAAVAAPEDAGGPSTKRRKVTPAAERDAGSRISAPFARRTVRVAEDEDEGGAAGPTFASIRAATMQAARQQHKQQHSADSAAPEDWMVAAGLAPPSAPSATLSREVDMSDVVSDLEEGEETAQLPAPLSLRLTPAASSGEAGEGDEEGEVRSNVDAGGGDFAGSWARRETQLSSMWRVGSIGSASAASAAAAASASPTAAASPLVAAARAPAAMLIAPADPLSGASVRSSVLSALNRALKEGNAADIASGGLYESALTTALQAGRERSLAEKMARETAETQVLRPAVVQAFATRIEAALQDIYPPPPASEGAAAASSSAASASASPNAGAAAGGTGTVSAEYRQRARALLAALRDPRNTGLRQQLFGGELQPLRLVQLDAAELAPDTVQAEWADLQHAADAAATLRDAYTAEADKPCPHCGVTGGLAYQHISGLRDIRKAEIWGGSGADEVKIAYRCDRCGKTWVETGG